tara:strand:+ start:70 stop:915 length:846 start_codon:yes stop_codon:yes gene_type:complete
MGNGKRITGGVNLAGSGGSINDFQAAVSAAGGLNDQTLYQITFPPLLGVKSIVGFNRELNLLCSSVTLPQRNPTFMGKQIGTVRKSMVNGFSKNDISMTFILLKDLTAQKYFKAWQQKIFNPNNHEMGYYKDYVKNVTISQYGKRPRGLDFTRVVDEKVNTKGETTTTTTYRTGRNEITKISSTSPMLSTITINGGGGMIFFDKVQEYNLIDAFPIVIDGEDGQTLTAAAPDDPTSSLNVTFSYKEYVHTFEGINKKLPDEEKEEKKNGKGPPREKTGREI